MKRKTTSNKKTIGQAADFAVEIATAGAKYRPVEACFGICTAAICTIEHQFKYGRFDAARILIDYVTRGIGAALLKSEKRELRAPKKKKARRATAASPEVER